MEKGIPKRRVGAILTDGLAVALSWILNPLIIPGASYALLLYQFGGSTRGVLHGAFLGILIFAIIPGAGILWLRQKGAIDSFDIRTKEQRVKPMALGLGCSLLALAVVFNADFPSQPLILAGTLAFFIVGLLVFFVTKYWKISIHLSTYASLIAAIVIGLPEFESLFSWPQDLTGPLSYRYFSPAFEIAVILGAPLLAWARVHCKVHSYAQVIGGFLLGLIVHLTIFYSLNIWIA